MKVFTRPLLICCLILFAPRSANSDTLINTLSGNGLGVFFISAPPGGSSGGGPYSSAAAGFTIPAGTDYALSSLQVELQFFNLNSVPSFSLYDTNGLGNPGSLLLNFPSLAYSVGGGTFTLTPLTPPTLQNTKTYWIVAANAASVANSFTWGENTVDAPPVGVASSAGSRRGTPLPSTSFSSQFRYVVTGTPIPEPSMCTLGAISLACLSLRRWYRRV